MSQFSSQSIMILLHSLILRHITNVTYLFKKCHKKMKHYSTVLLTQASDAHSLLAKRQVHATAVLPRHIAYYVLLMSRVFCGITLLFVQQNLHNKRNQKFLSSPFMLYNLSSTSVIRELISELLNKSPKYSSSQSRSFLSNLPFCDINFNNSFM